MIWVVSSQLTIESDPPDQLNQVTTPSPIEVRTRDAERQNLSMRMGMRPMSRA
jgi:hypothetical protein